LRRYRRWLSAGGAPRNRECVCVCVHACVCVRVRLTDRDRQRLAERHRQTCLTTGDRAQELGAERINVTSRVAVSFGRRNVSTTGNPACVRMDGWKCVNCQHPLTKPEEDVTQPCTAGLPTNIPAGPLMRAVTSGMLCPEVHAYVSSLFDSGSNCFVSACLVSLFARRHELTWPTVSQPSTAMRRSPIWIWPLVAAGSSGSMDRIECGSAAVGLLSSLHCGVHHRDLKITFPFPATGEH